MGENRIKYRSLLNELHRINTKLGRLETEYKELDKTIEENIIINDKKANNEELSEIKNTIEEMRKSLNNILIKKVSRKI